MSSLPLRIQALEARTQTSTTQIINIQNGTALSQAFASLLAQPSSTLAVDLSKGPSVYVGLDTSGTIAKASNQPAAGVVVTFALQQKGAGLFSPSWHASWSIPSTFLPRQGSGQVCYVSFISNGDGTFSFQSHNGIDTSKPLNVRDWGAVGDGSTDDSAAIQACIDYAQSHFLTASGVEAFNSVYFPTGLYHTTKPLMVSNLAAPYGVRLFGDGKQHSRFNQEKAFGGPVIIGSPKSIYVTNPIPLSASNMTGLGKAMTFDNNVSNPSAANAWWIGNALYGQWSALNGLSAFTVEVDFNQSVATSYNSNSIICSIGTTAIDGTPTRAFQLQVQNFGAATLVGTMNIGGSTIAVSTPFSSTGSWHHAAMTYDGANVKLWLDGVLQATSAATGTVTQSPYEEIIIGAQPEYTPADGTSNVFPLPCKMDFVRVSNVARYTSGFTPPSAKPTPDASTIFQTNFETTSTGFLGAYGDGMCFKHYFSMTGVGLTSAYSLARTTYLGGGMSNIQVEDLGFDCYSAIEGQIIQQVDVQRCDFNVTSVGLYMVNNCYRWCVADITMDGSAICAGGGGVGIVTSSAANLNIFKNYTLTGGLAFSAIQGRGYKLSDAYLNSTGAILVGSNGGDDGIDAIWDNVFVGDEGSSGTVSSVIFRDARFLGTGCTVEKIGTTDTNASILLSGQNRISWAKSMFNVRTPAAGVFAAPNTVQTAPIVMLDSAERWAFGASDPARPLNSTPSKLVIVDRHAQAQSVNHAASPYTAAGNGEFRCDATSGTITFNLPPALGSGAEYVVKKTDSSANAVTLTPNGADKIDGAGSLALSAQYKYARLVDGASGAWDVTGSN